MIQESNKKVELQKKENQELIQENIAVNKELDKTIHKNKTLRQITGGSVVLTVAVVVAAIIVL